MVEFDQNPNTELIANAEVLSVDGYIGNFKVKIRKNPRYVIEKNCTGCGECSAVCPVEYPNQWEEQIGTRKAISVPFPQAVPLAHTINREHCIDCYKCVDVCGERKAIDFEQKPEEIEIEVGTITVATGFDLYDPSDDPKWGYGKYQNIITGMEAEWLTNAAGPTNGEFIRASDGKHPRSVTFIQCVGSRDVNKHEYCTGFCCMYAIKDAIFLKEHDPDMEVNILYMDIRTAFKGYEEFYRRARNLGVTFVRGRPDKVFETENNNLVIRVNDTNLGEAIEIETELVVLSTAGVPKSGSDEVSRVLHVTRDPAGFFFEAHAKLKPLDSPTDGIFFAGACQGLKDIPYSVAQGSGAAARAATILSKDIVEIEPIVAKVDPAKCLHSKANCTVCQKVCPYNACSAPKGAPMEINPAMCHGCGTCVADCPADAITQQHFTDEQMFTQIRAALKDNPEEKIMGFLCNWCCYAGADLAGTSRFSYPSRIRVIRTMCAGRVDVDFVYEALRLGAGAVFIGACHLPLDCHYISGNVWMKERMEKLHAKLTKEGMSPERLHIGFVSAAEGVIFANKMKLMDKQLTDLGVDRIREENAKLRPGIEKILGRKGLLPNS